MANALYDKGREGFLDGSIDWDTDDIKVCLLDGADYTPSLTTDDTLIDIAAAAIVATSGNLASKTCTGGVADAADVTLTSVSGDAAEYIGCYKDSSSSPLISRLIFLIDTATGLPVTPSGGDIEIQWDNGANAIFKL